MSFKSFDLELWSKTDGGLLDVDVCVCKVGLIEFPTGCVSFFGIVRKDLGGGAVRTDAGRLPLKFLRIDYNMTTDNIHYESNIYQEPVKDSSYH